MDIQTWIDTVTRKDSVLWREDFRYTGTSNKTQLIGVGRK